MAFNISYIYKAVDRFSSTANQMARSANNFTNRVKKSNIEIAKLGRGIRNMGARIATFVTTSLGLFSFGMLKAAGTMEQMEVSFESMLGSADKAKILMKDLVTFAAKTPFELTGISGATKQLLAFGVKQEDIVGQLQVLGDIAAGANVPLRDMAAIFGKSKAKGKAMTEELLQLSDRGIPIIDVLAKKFKVAKGEIFEAASQGKISFKIVSNALESMTKKGGIFHKQMIKQSRTLFGLFSTMRDVIFNAFAVMGDDLIKVTNLKDKMVELSKWIEIATEKFKSLSPKTKQMIANAALLVAALGPLLLLIGGLVIAFALIASPIGLVVMGIAAVSAAAMKFKPIGDSIRVVFHLIRLTVDSLVESLKAVGDVISGLIPDFGILDKLSGFFNNGGVVSIGGFADYLSNQGREVDNPKGINAQNNNASINGKILVEATGDSKVVSTQSKTTGMSGNLGINMSNPMGAY